MLGKMKLRIAHIGIRIVISFVTVFCLSEVRADGKVSYCLDIFRAVVKNYRSNFGKWPSPIIEDHPLNTDLFGVVEEIPGEYGGKRFRVARRLSWSDPRKDLLGGADLVQDLRAYPLLLGESGARFFGFQIVDHNRGVFPDITEINGAIDRFNEGLPENALERITLRPKKVTSEKATLTSYIRDFVKEGGIAHDSKGKGYWHDLSAHSLSGLHSHPEVEALLQVRAEFVLALIDHFSKAGLEGFAEVRKKLLGLTSGPVDNIGNEMFTYFPNRQLNRLYRHAQIEWFFLPKIERWRVYKWAHAAIVGQGYLDYGLDFLVEKPLNWVLKNLPETYHAETRSFFDQYRILNPNIEKVLSFDLIGEHAALRKLNKKKGNLSHEDLMSFTVSKPFALRLERLRKLSQP
jgi:hypothetical protein